MENNDSKTGSMEEQLLKNFQRERLRQSVVTTNQNDNK